MDLSHIKKGILDGLVPRLPQMTTCIFDDPSLKHKSAPLSYSHKQLTYLTCTTQSSGQSILEVLQASIFGVRAKRRPRRPSRGCIVKSHHVRPPLGLVHTNDASVIRHQSVHFALHICCLRPHAARACIYIGLITQLREQLVGAMSPCFR
jgi:hypothetical protein